MCKTRNGITEEKMNLEITDAVEKQDEQTVRSGLLAYNLARIEDKNSLDLGIFLRDKAGDLQAGLIGDTHGNWLFVKYLWVSEELRGQGIGRQMLLQAESTAKERGCKYAFLDTFDFQAPAFYQKYGYEQVFVLDEYPLTGRRHYFTKKL